jgi:hypothetical protein
LNSPRIFAPYHRGSNLRGLRRNPKALLSRHDVNALRALQHHSERSIGIRSALEPLLGMPRPNAFCRLNDFRRIRYDRLARNFLASICLVAAIVWRDFMSLDPGKTVAPELPASNGVGLLRGARRARVSAAHVKHEWLWRGQLRIIRQSATFSSWHVHREHAGESGNIGPQSRVGFDAEAQFGPSSSYGLDECSF